MRIHSGRWICSRPLIGHRGIDDGFKWKLHLYTGCVIQIGACLKTLYLIFFNASGCFTTWISHFEALMLGIFGSTLALAEDIPLIWVGAQKKLHPNMP